MTSNIRLILLVVFFTAAGVMLWRWQHTVSAPETGDPSPMATAPAQAPTPDPLQSPLPSAQQATPAVVETASLPQRTPTGRGTIRGMVVDDRDYPVENAHIRAHRGRINPLDPAPLDTPEYTTTTGADGRFELNRMPFGGYAVLAVTNSAVTTEGIQIHPNRPVADTRFTLEPAGVVTGRVLSPEGEPIENARVGILTYNPVNPNHANQLRGPRFTVETDSEGRFSIDYLRIRSCQLYAIAPEYAPAASAAIQPSARNVEIILEPAATLNAIVRLADTREPFPNAEFTLAGEWYPEIVDVTAGPDGRFTLHDLRHEPANLFFHHETHALVAGPSQRVTPGDAEVEVLVAPGATIAGRVTAESTGEGLPNITLNAYYEAAGRAAAKTATTDRQGQFTFNGLEAGRYSVQIIEARGFSRDMPARAVELRLGETLDNLNFTLHSGVRVTGLVIDHAGQPVEGVHVNAIQARATPDYTDAHGRFILAGLNPGETIKVAADNGEYFTTSGLITLPSSGDLANLTLTLEPAGYLAGEVRRPDGALAEDAVVRLERPDNRPFPHRGGIQTTTGRFESPPLPPGKYFIAADSSTPPIEIDLEPGQFISDITVTAAHGTGRATPTRTPGVLPPGRDTITGQVVDMDGEPAPTVVVRATSADKGNSIATTNAQGEFTIQVASNGFFDLRTASDKYTNVSQPNVPSGARGVILRLEPTATIQANIIPAPGGPPITTVGTAVYLVPPEHADWPYRANWVQQQAENGLIEIPGVEGRRPLTLTVRADGYAPNTVTVPPILPGGTSHLVNVVLSPGGRIVGRVRNTDGQPIPAARVNRLDPQRGAFELTRTDGLGNFSIEHVAERALELRVEHQNYAAKVLSLSLNPSATTNLDVTLERGGAIEGVARRGQTPIQNAQLTFTTSNQHPIRQVFNARTNEEGQYTIQGLPQGEVEVTLHVPGPPQQSGRRFTQAAYAENGKITEVNFILPADTGVLEGFITADGPTSGRAQVTVIVDSAIGPTSANAIADPETGAYIIEDILPGTAAVTAYVNTGPPPTDILERGIPQGSLRRMSQTTEIRSGRVTRLDFHFQSTGTLTGLLAGLLPGETGTIILLPPNFPANDPSPEAINQIQRQAINNTQTNPDGTFQLPHLEPGPYTILAIAITGTPQSLHEALATTRYQTTQIQIPPNANITLNLTL